MNIKTFHIDTLYLSYNCSFDGYIKALDIIADMPLAYYRQGRHYYDFGYCRVGWLDWEICQKGNNYPFVIEYNFEYLYQTDLLNDHTQIKLPFNDVFETFLIKRLDNNCTFKSYDNILEKLFVSKYFKKGNNWWGDDRKTETVNLGLRKTGKTFRIYNKTQELDDKKNVIKTDMLKKVFGKNLDNLYSIEVEVLRKYIITRTKLYGSLDDFQAVVDMTQVLLASVRYCDYTQSNISLIRSKNYEKVNFTYLTKFLGSIEFKAVKKYEKSKENMIATIDKMLLQYNSYKGEKLSHKDLADEIKKINICHDL